MRVAIHPKTLDLREFRPGMGYKDKGYVVVNGAEGLYEVQASWVQALVKKISGERHTHVTLRICTLIWPDIVVRALNNLKAKVEENQTPDAGEREVEPERIELENNFSHRVDGLSKLKLSKVGRGNHIPRYPDFEILGAEIRLRVPAQVHVLAMEFRKLKEAGTTIIEQKNIKKVIEDMKLATRQDPLRIFRYYFWVLVRTGVLRPVNGVYFCDKVVQQCAFRGVFDPWETVTELDVKNGKVCTYGQK